MKNGDLSSVGWTLILWDIGERASRDLQLSTSLYGMHAEVETSCLCRERACA